jgi:hypothetical protein
LEEVRAMSKEWILTEEETRIYEETIARIDEKLINDLQQRLSEVNTQLNTIKGFIERENSKELRTYIEEKLQISLSNFHDDPNQDTYDMVEDTDYDDTDKDKMEEYSKNLIQTYLNMIDITQKTLDNEEEINKLKNAAYQKAKQDIINTRLNRYKNTYVMETTPLGNVLMCYDVKKNLFVYYSDKTIPYRYLEVVCRKYVKTFNCRPIYVDMEEDFETIKKTHEQNTNETKETTTDTTQKQKVFATFKNYSLETKPKNRSANTANNIPNKHQERKEDSKQIIKEKTNQYISE